MRRRYADQGLYTDSGMGHDAPGKISVDAEIVGCSMLIESFFKMGGQMCECSLSSTVVSLSPL